MKPRKPARNRGLTAPDQKRKILDLNSSADLMRVAPRDAFHLVIAIHHGISALVTADSDFDEAQLPGERQLTIVKF